MPQGRVLIPDEVARREELRQFQERLANHIDPIEVRVRQFFNLDAQRRAALRQSGSRKERRAAARKR